MEDSTDIKGIKGWLAFVGMGVILSPLIIIGTSGPNYVKIFSDGTWEILTTPGTHAFQPLWAPVLIGEIIVNSGLVLAWSFAIFLFFATKKTFPSYYIGLRFAALVWVAVNPYIAELVVPDGRIFTPEVVQALIMDTVGTSIWVPYMAMSKRVKATFVK
ncbi:MAG: DUF2569 domain-containing protein [Bdellovibrionota bacterium]